MGGVELKEEGGGLNFVQWIMDRVLFQFVFRCYFIEIMCISICQTTKELV